MATFSSVTRQHVLQALAEYDARGGEEFLEVYGFGPSGDYALIHDGLSYDSRAVLGVAHRFATGRLATSDDFSSDMQGAVAILRKRGFEVTEPRTPPRPTPVRRHAHRAPPAPPGPRRPVRRRPGRRRPRHPAADLPDVLHDPPRDGHLRRLRLRTGRRAAAVSPRRRCRSHASAPRAATTPVLNDAWSR